MQTKAGTERIDAFSEEFLRVRARALRIAAKIEKRENELKTQLKRLMQAKPAEPPGLASWLPAVATVTAALCAMGKAV